MDKMLKGWTIGNSNPIFQKQLQDVPLLFQVSESMFAIGYSNTYFTVGMLTSLAGNQQIHYAKSGLESPIHSIALLPANPPKVALGSVDGRIEIFNVSQSGGSMLSAS